MATAGKISGVSPIRKDHDSRELAARDTATLPIGTPLIFELSSDGRAGADLAPRTKGARSGAEILGPELCRDDLRGFPELSEPQVMRHYLRLSQLNFAQALQFYPLGSCTMKYNPVINDEIAALPGFANLHPLTPPHLAQ